MDPEQKPIEPVAGFSWRYVRETRSRPVLRTLDHTKAVRGFRTAVAEQGYSHDWDLLQIGPPQRAPHFSRLKSRMRSNQPDPFGVLNCDRHERPHFFKWKRGAIRPSIMARGLAPYLRYYTSRRPN